MTTLNLAQINNIDTKWLYMSIDWPDYVTYVHYSILNSFLPYGEYVKCLQFPLPTNYLMFAKETKENRETATPIKL